MAKLNKNESAQVLSLMEHKGWEPLMKLLTATVNDLNSREVQGQNAFETLRSLHTSEGKVAGLTEFFKDLTDGVSLTE